MARKTSHIMNAPLSMIGLLFVHDVTEATLTLSLAKPVYQASKVSLMSTYGEKHDPTLRGDS